MQYWYQFSSVTHANTSKTANFTRLYTSTFYNIPQPKPFNLTITLTKGACSSAIINSTTVF